MLPANWRTNIRGERIPRGSSLSIVVYTHILQVPILFAQKSTTVTNFSKVFRRRKNANAQRITNNMRDPTFEWICHQRWLSGYSKMTMSDQKFRIIIWVVALCLVATAYGIHTAWLVWRNPNTMHLCTYTSLYQGEMLIKHFSIKTNQCNVLNAWVRGETRFGD